jgi:hypothetical protein
LAKSTPASSRAACALLLEKRGSEARMRNGRKHTVAVSVGGVLGGLVGTAAIQKAAGLSQKLPEPLHMPRMTRDPGDYVVTRVEELAGTPLSPAAHARAARAARWVYGLAWAGSLASLARPLRMDRALNAALGGAAMGALSWAAGYFGWLPRAGITEPVARERSTNTAAALIGHVLFGLLAAAPIFASERMYRRRRRPLARRLLLR